MKPVFRAAIALVLATSGCATSRVAGWEELRETVRLSEAEAKTQMTLGKTHWARRHVREDLEAALKSFERVARSEPGAPGTYEALVLLCRGYYLLADGHVEDPAEKRVLWEKGASWGEKAMATNPEFRRRVGSGAELAALARAQVDALYWTAVNLGQWAESEGVATALKFKGQVRQMMKRVQELDPDYFYGAVNRYWGVYYAEAPYFAGGSLDKSLENFQGGFRIANKYLAGHVLFAERYARRKGDRELFRRELELVLAADPRALPEVAPEQILEQRKAKKMLASMEEYF